MWALGNIAGENTDFRNVVLESGVLPPLLKLLSTTSNISILKNGSWLLSNLVRGKPQPDFYKLKDVRNNIILTYRQFLY